MSVYTEEFLQNNVVNYKLILIRNHKRKVIISSLNRYSSGRKNVKVIRERLYLDLNAPEI